MQRIINFFITNKYALLYFVLLGISLFLTIQNNSYHRSKYINSVTLISGGVYNASTVISEYFHLKKQNQLLQQENNYLKTLLYNTPKNNPLEYKLDSSLFTYQFIPAKVLKNSFSSATNYLLLDKGKNNNVTKDLGVVTPNGILGIIDDVSSKYARVLSILNTKTRISAQLKKTNHFGTLKWDGKNPNIVQLVDIPSKAILINGDTIITSGRSAIFPKNLLIGIIDSYTLDNAKDFYEINVKLFNDMTNVNYAYVIKNKDANEIKNLLSVENEN